MGYLLPARGRHPGNLGLTTADYQRYMTNGRISSPLQILQAAKTPATITVKPTSTMIRVVERPPIAAPTIAPAPAPVPTAAQAAAVAGTPVPASFSTNQFFVAPDGSVWQFGGGKWFNTGTPYSPPGASAAAATPAASTSNGALTATPAPAASAPVVNVAAPASDYQTLLDWLTQQTLIVGYPNWIIASGVALAGWFLVSRNKGGR